MTATMVFVFISNLQFAFFGQELLPSGALATGDEVDEHHHDGNHQQDMMNPLIVELVTSPSSHRTSMLSQLCATHNFPLSWL